MKGIFVGLTTLDLIHYVDRFPLADEKIQAEDRWIGAGGPAANAAITFAALGGSAELITALGQSPAAQIARRDLEAASVSVQDLAREGEIAISSITVDRAGRRTVVSVNAAGFGDLRSPEESGEPADVVLADGHHVAAALPLLDAARARDCPTVFDGGSRKPGTEEMLERMRFVIASSAFASGRPAEEVVAELLHSPVRLAAISQGSDPIVGVTEAGPFMVDIPAVEAVDTLGAGDVLHGAFAHSLCGSDDALQALREAVVVASQACTARGPRLPR
jgi:sugar/nucleoside kinase (ribokinase family)